MKERIAWWLNLSRWIFAATFICPLKGHMQAWEDVTIEPWEGWEDGEFIRVRGVEGKAGYCARCNQGLITFDPPLLIPACSEQGR